MVKFLLGLVQLKVSSIKSENLKRASALVKKAVEKGCKLVCLPECFNSPYGTQFFQKYAEDLKGETTTALSKMALENDVYLIGGSFPELRGTKLYNTCTVWDRNGSMIGIHRKIHLFDIDMPGMVFKESDTLSPGNEMTIIDTEYGKIGLGICYDMRFPELAMIASRKGCMAMIYPGAFNTTTGPLHWELLQRARAIDNQIYVAACSPARDLEAGYQAWGHSTIVDPMANIIATCQEDEAIVVGEIDSDLLTKARSSIPVSSQRRFDVYPDVSKLDPYSNKYP
jgi:omega-amidase